MTNWITVDDPEVYFDHRRAAWMDDVSMTEMFDLARGRFYQVWERISSKDTKPLSENVATLPRIEGLKLVTFIEPFDFNRDGRSDLMMFVPPKGYEVGAKVVALMNSESGFEVDERYFPPALFSGSERWMGSAFPVDLNGVAMRT